MAFGDSARMSRAIFMMHEPGRWSISPAYDLNPAPEMDRVRACKTPISEEPEDPTVAGVLAASARFDPPPAAAMKILREVFTAVSRWRQVARQLGIQASALDAYASAFEHPLMEKAGGLCGGITPK